MTHIQIAVNGILFDFDEEKHLATHEKTCATCILNSNVCESKCLDINVKLHNRSNNK